MTFLSNIKLTYFLKLKEVLIGGGFVLGRAAQDKYNRAGSYHTVSGKELLVLAAMPGPVPDSVGNQYLCPITGVCTHHKHIHTYRDIFLPDIYSGTQVVKRKKK
jgi:hypothetical protein